MYVARHVCNLYFIVIFCDLTLTLIFLSMPFVFMQYPLWTSLPSTLGECNLFAARVTDPRAQKAKTFHCDL